MRAVAVPPINIVNAVHHTFTRYCMLWAKNKFWIKRMRKRKSICQWVDEIVNDKAEMGELLARTYVFLFLCVRECVSSPQRK